MSRSIAGRLKRASLAERATLAIVATAALSLATAGCGPDLAGSAATIGADRITDEALTTQVQAVTTGLKIPASPRVSAAILQRMLTTQLVAALAAANKVTVTQGEVDSFIAAQTQQAGGKTQFEAQVLQSGIAASDIQSAVRTTLLVQKLGPVLAPGKSEQEQQVATAAAAVKLAQQLNVSVSPRFGTWQGVRLQVGPVPDDLSAMPVNASGLSPLSQGQDPSQQTQGQSQGQPQGQDPGQQTQPQPQGQRQGQSQTQPQRQ